MPKIDTQAFKALGEMIRPPAAPKARKDVSWSPDLNPTQQALFDCDAPYILAWSEKFSGKTIGCLHKVMKHVYENRNAFAILLTRTGNMSKDGGSWHKLVTDILPQWEAGLGLKTKFGTDKQHNTFVWIQNQFDEWSMIMDTSAPNPEQLDERFRGREPSIVFVDELTSCNSPKYFTAIAAQLNRRPGVDGVQQYIAATNPDDPEHWVHKLFFDDAFNEETGEWSKSYVNFYFPKQENVKRVGEGYFKGLSEIYKGDSAGAQWMIEGHWVPRASGDGLFRSIYDPIIHVRPLTDDGKADPRRLLSPDKGSPMIIGMDPGSVYNAFVFQQYIKINGKMKWLIFDEIVSIKKRISYDAFIPIVMKRIRWWRDKVGAEIPMVWISDNSAFNQYRAAQGSFDVLEIERIYEANRARLKLESVKIKQCPKAPGSVVVRTRLGQKMLAEEEVIVSAWCTKVQKMFLMLEGKKAKPGEPLDPEALLTPQRSDFIHTWDAVSYPWLMNALIPTALLPSRGGEQTLIRSAA